MWKVDLKKDKTGERRPRKKQSQGKTLPIVLLTKGKLQEKKRPPKKTSEMSQETGISELESNVIM